MHGWHLFDTERGYEVKRESDCLWRLRNREGEEWELTVEEFNQLRSAGTNPQEIP